MSDESQTSPKPLEQPASTQLPPQASPQDTSNWDGRTFTTPSGRIVIETDQTGIPDVVAE